MTDLTEAARKELIRQAGRHNAIIEHRQNGLIKFEGIIDLRLLAGSIQTASHETGQLWRHKKRDNVYRTLKTGIIMQCSTDEAFEERFGEQFWVLYKKATLEDTPWFIRLESEFLDGRFELVDEQGVRIR